MPSMLPTPWARRPTCRLHCERVPLAGVRTESRLSGHRADAEGHDASSRRGRLPTKTRVHDGLCLRSPVNSNCATAASQFFAFSDLVLRERAQVAQVSCLHREHRSWRRLGFADPQDWLQRKGRRRRVETRPPTPSHCWRPGRNTQWCIWRRHGLWRPRDDALIHFTGPHYSHRARRGCGRISTHTAIDEPGSKR